MDGKWVLLPATRGDVPTTYSRWVFATMSSEGEGEAEAEAEGEGEGEGEGTSGGLTFGVRVHRFRFGRVRELGLRA